MPLPTDPNALWPPPSEVDIQRDIREADAWYSGDQAKLISFYGAPAAEDTQSVWSRFWSRQSTDTKAQRQRIHVPAAADVAATAADLLFGDEPRFVIPEAHEYGDGDQPQPLNPDAQATEARLAELAELDGWGSKLLEGAEIASALGGVYLRPLWDPATADHPMLTLVHPDSAVPEFWHGQLQAVTFWREVPSDGKKTWRHLERHEAGPPGKPGVILHGLYVGDHERLGQRVPLNANPATTRLLAATAPDEAIRLPADVRLDVRYVPNAVNRKRRASCQGRADTAGAEGLMDSLDEAMTSWMRDIRLGKGRIIVAAEFLENRTGQKRGGGKMFDLDAEVFSPLEMDPQHAEKAGITPSQFDIRVDEHDRTTTALFEKIIGTAGYSPQSFGLQGDGGLKTATEVDAEDSKSQRTTSRKERLWSRAAADVAEILLIFDREYLGNRKVTPMRPRLEYVDPEASNMREVASTLSLLTAARAASIETKVRMVHPDWEEPQIRAEAARIRDEEGVGDVPDPTDGFPA